MRLENRSLQDPDPARQSMVEKARVSPRESRYRGSPTSDDAHVDRGVDAFPEFDTCVHFVGDVRFVFLQR
jgi:hypothetical protein